MRSFGKFPLLVLAAGVFCGTAGTALYAQDAVPSAAAVVVPYVVPHVVRYGGTLRTSSSASLAPVALRFAFYSSQTGGEPLWSETQEVTLDAMGRYSVLLGGTTATGLPQGVFSSGEARWLGVTVGNEPEQARTALVATPYSLKASDAETVGGHPASDFRLAPKDANGRPEAATDISQINVSEGILGGGTGPTVALRLDPTYFQELAANFALKNGGNAFTGNQSIAGNLSVSGSLTGPSVLSLSNANVFKAAQTLGAVNVSTSSKGYASNALEFAASGYNSTASVPEAITFAWQAEPVANNTSAPSATMNLLYATGANAPAETGFKVGSNGVLTFAAGQTYPGAGMITGITTASPLAGGGTSGSVALSLNTAALETTLSGKYAQLAAGNTFSGVNAFTDGVSASASGIGIAGSATSTVHGVQAFGVQGTTANPSDSAGVYGFAPSGDNSNGVEGVQGGLSTSGAAALCCGGAGVWGDTNAAVNPSADMTAYGVLGTADAGYGGYFANNGSSPSYLPALLAISNSSSTNSEILEALNYSSGNSCTIDYMSDLACDGTLSGRNVTEDKHALATYAVQSAESWTEDAGGAQLTSGHAHIDLETQFAKVVNTGADYHVFLTPEGDCKGLYVAEKTATGFDVRELGGGQTSVAFSYRIMARRRGFEGERLKDVTESRNRDLSRGGGPNVARHSLLPAARGSSK